MGSDSNWRRNTRRITLCMPETNYDRLSGTSIPQLGADLRNQYKNPALASIVRDRRIQVLPVQWRASLQLDQQDSQEDVEHGMDNRFTMADITINKSIPYVRELTNSVLLDIPLFMSQHRLKMIEAVCLQANKLYRLWMARNPGWKGRIHLIGHSVCRCKDRS